MAVEAVARAFALLYFPSVQGNLEHEIMKRTLGFVAFCGLLIASTGLLQAHHSLAGVYDMKNDKELSGTVTP